MAKEQDKIGVNWPNCPYWNQCEDGNKHIMTYCDVQCSNPIEKHRLDKPDESRTRKQFESNIQELHAYDTGYFCGKQAKGMDRPDREIQEIIRQFYWYARENPTKGRTINLEKLTETVANQIQALIPEQRKLDRPDREKVAEIVYLAQQDVTQQEWEDLSEAEQELWKKDADLILALFDEEEIRKQEMPED